MERKNLALLCAGVVCFWLFALAFGTAQGSGLRRQSPAVQTAVQPQGPVQLTAEPPALELPCRAACLIDQQTGTVLYEKNADQQMPIASIAKVMTLLLTFEAVHNGQLTMDTPVPVSEHAYHMGGSQIWLEPGEVHPEHLPGGAALHWHLDRHPAGRCHPAGEHQQAAAAV